MPPSSSSSPLLTRNRILYLVLGLALRLLLLFAGIVSDSRNPSLPYTDVDYHVFTSGAHHLLNGCPIAAAVPPRQPEPFDTLREFTDPPGTVKDGCAKGWLAVGARYILQHEDVLVARSRGAQSAELKRRELGQSAGLSLIEPNRVETLFLPVSLAILRPILRPLAAMGNPYARPTYRYTPLLAALLVPGAWAGQGSFVEKIWGKLLFVIADLTAGVLMWTIALRRRRSLHSDKELRGPPPTFPASIFGRGGSLSRLLSQPTHSVGLLWLLNPFPAQIATRGSSEAILCVIILGFVSSVTMLVEGSGIDDDESEVAVARTVSPPADIDVTPYDDFSDERSSTSTDDNSTILACPPPDHNQDAVPSAASKPRHPSASSLPLPTLPLPLLVSPLLLTLAAHLKLFPIFYGVPVLAALLFRVDKSGRRRGQRWTDASLFTVICVYSFLGLGVGVWLIWGQPFLQNSLLYHLTRQDHRHNFSPYFLPLYLLHTPSVSGSLPLLLSSASGDDSVAALWTKVGSFAPQILVVVYIGYKIGRKGDVLAACAAQSMAFVILNKVGTSQYFLWYLPFLPPLLPSLSFSSPTQPYLLLLIWASAQALWLSQAYLLEMKALDVYLRVWIAGLVYVVAMAWVLVALMRAWERGRSGLHGLDAAEVLSRNQNQNGEKEGEEQEKVDSVGSVVRAGKEEEEEEHRRISPSSFSSPTTSALLLD